MNIEKDIDDIAKRAEENARKIEENANKIHQNTGALEVLHTIKGYTNYFFVMWLITFFALLMSIGYILFVK